MEEERRGREEPGAGCSCINPFSFLSNDYTSSPSLSFRDGRITRASNPFPFRRYNEDDSSSSAEGRNMIIGNDNAEIERSGRRRSRRNRSSSAEAEGRIMRPASNDDINAETTHNERSRRARRRSRIRRRFWVTIPTIFTGDAPDRAALERLRCIIISEEHINRDDDSQCSICQEPYRILDQTRIMGCGHMHHQICLFEWLKNHRTCPVCRYRMP